MPILPPEPDRYPDTLLTDALGEGRHWWVLHTKPRQEKSLARQLLRGRVPFYLPLIQRRNASRGRVLTSSIPLFAGYCFVMANEQERIRALTTNRVVKALTVPDQEQLGNDLRQIQRLIDSGIAITPEGRLAPGEQVEIRSGPLAGLQGVIIRQANRQRFVVQVDFIQQGASLEVEDFMIARIV